MFLELVVYWDVIIQLFGLHCYIDFVDSNLTALFLFVDTNYNG